MLTKPRTRHLDATLLDLVPHAHSVSGDPESGVLESRPGGRIYERTRNGDEIDWGEVTRWEPPNRLAYLWHIRRDRAQATQVDIRFIALEDGTTQIDRALGLGGIGRRRRDLAQRQPWRVEWLLPHDQVRQMLARR